LFGIGLTSWNTDKSAETFKAMLQLKKIFSFAAIAGTLFGAYTAPSVPWGVYVLILPTFIAFHLMWQYFDKNLQVKK
jgi:hypothetical protein